MQKRGMALEPLQTMCLKVSLSQTGLFMHPPGVEHDPHHEHECPLMQPKIIVQGCISSFKSK